MDWLCVVLTSSAFSLSNGLNDVHWTEMTASICRGKNTERKMFKCLFFYNSNKEEEAEEERTTTIINVIIVATFQTQATLEAAKESIFVLNLRADCSFDLEFSTDSQFVCVSSDFFLLLILNSTKFANFRKNTKKFIIYCVFSCCEFRNALTFLQISLQKEEKNR